MTKLKIKNPRFELISSIDKDFKEVQVIFEYQEEEYKHFIFIGEGKKVNYLKEAKKQFYRDLKDGKVIQPYRKNVLKNNRLWFIATTCVLGVVAVTFASLFLYKALNRGESGGDFLTITLDAGNGSTVELTPNDQIFKYYVKKGTTFKQALESMKYRGGIKSEKDFLYWTMNGNPISSDYVINNSIKLDAAYKTSSSEYLTITARVDNTSITFTQDVGLQISTNGSSWSEVTESPKTVNLKNKGNQVYVKRTSTTALNLPANTGICFGDQPHTISGPIEALRNKDTSTVPNNMFKNCFLGDKNLLVVHNLILQNVEISTSCFEGIFQDCSLLELAPDLIEQSLQPSCYKNMFKNCASLIKTPELPALTMQTSCYQSMFENCSSLTDAPNLNSTSLATSCYEAMFKGCESLASTPTLGATELKEACYKEMFSGCKLITSAPELNSTSLATGCYQSMFENCSSLIDAPDLNSTSLATSCYEAMFKGCESLTSIPTLGATELKEACYKEMFSGCKLITSAPELNSTSLAASCYDSMFYDCTSLEDAPTLLATELKDYCYAYMFSGCVNITTPPELNTTSLAVGCYQGMFSASGITTTPVLPATELKEACYSEMFTVCNNLTSISNISATSLAASSCNFMFAFTAPITINDTGSGTAFFTCPSSSDPYTDAMMMFYEQSVTSADGTPTTGQTYYYE